MFGFGKKKIESINPPGPYLPSWAKQQLNGEIHVVSDEIYPIWLKALGLGEPITQEKLEICRRCMQRYLLSIVGTMYLRIRKGTAKYALKHWPCDANIGSWEFYYNRLEKELGIRGMHQMLQL